MKLIYSILASLWVIPFAIFAIGGWAVGMYYLAQDSWAGALFASAILAFAVWAFIPSRR